MKHSGNYQNTKIFLVRHAQSAWNGTKRISGQLDPPLSQKGKEQADNLAKVLMDVNISAIYTSTLSRAIETAMPTANYQSLSIQAKDAIKEIHFGILQGRYRDPRDPEALQIWNEREKDKTHYRIPDGETFIELEQRVIPCLNGIVANETGGAVLIVGHRSTNRIILGNLMHWPTDIYVKVDLRSKYLYEITIGDNPTIATINLDKKKLGAKYDGFEM